MSALFAGKRVVVTGGTGALGSAVVAALRAEGASCVVPVRDAASAARSPHAGDPGVRFEAGVDLTEEAAVEAFYAGCEDLYASVQVAGGFAMAPLEQTSLAQLEAMLALNLHTCFLCCREATRLLRRGGVGGRLVNVAARPALVPTGGMLAYAVSKSAVAALTTSLAEELAPEGIWVNAIVPSIIDTPSNRAAMPGADASRWPKVEQLARAVVELASPANEAVRGALVPVYGRA